MKRKTLQLLVSSKKDNWRTGKKALRPVRLLAKLLGVTIALDPAGHPKSIVKAERQFLLQRGENGLRRSWQVRGLIYCNPPYGCEGGNTRKPKTLPWLQKMIRQQRKARGKLHGVFLIAARTDSVQVFQDTVYKHATAVCYVRGRLKFIGAASGALFPSAYVYFGRRPDLFKKAFDDQGHVDILDLRFARREFEEKERKAYGKMRERVLKKVLSTARLKKKAVA